MITKTHEDLAQKSVAIFSDCEKYRYYLQRTWDISKPSITYLLMNPSTADEMVNDPTLTRCQTRAMNWGYGQMIVVNVFAIRETHSEKLPEYEDLNGHIGDANDMIIKAVRESEITICGWGKYKDKNIEDRAHEIIDMLNRESLGSRLHALAVNADGSPKHPLYVAYCEIPKAYLSRPQIDKYRIQSQRLADALMKVGIEVDAVEEVYAGEEYHEVVFDDLYLIHNLSVLLGCWVNLGGHFSRTYNQVSAWHPKCFEAQSNQYFFESHEFERALCAALVEAIEKKLGIGEG